MSVLITTGRNNQRLNPTALYVVAAAAKLGNVSLLVAGSSAVATVGEAEQITGATKILVTDASYYTEGLAEELAPLVVKLAVNYRYVVVTAAAFGKNLPPRAAALLDIPQVSDLTGVVDNSTFVRPTYTDNTFEAIQPDSGKLVLTFRATVFDVTGQGGDAEVVNVETAPVQNLSHFVNHRLSQSNHPELTQAKVVVSGGRVLGSAEKFDEVLVPLAGVLSTTIDASHAAVDVEYALDDAQMGQADKMVTP